MSEKQRANTVHPDAESLFHELTSMKIYQPDGTIYTKCFVDEFPTHVIRGCESPIEQMLAVALWFYQPDLMVVRNQQEVVWFESLANQDERIFRPDFVVGLDWFMLTPDWEYASRGNWWESSEAYQWLPFFAVECDGRDYHNHHEAIERDKWRDRVFATRGMQVLRFTGSEIFRDAMGCADQVIDLFSFMLRERLKPGVKSSELVSPGSRIVLGKTWSD